MAHFYISAHQFRGFSELPVLHTKICEFKKRIGKIRIGAKRLLKMAVCRSSIPLALFDEADVEQASGIRSLPLQPLLEILVSFIETSQVAIGESQEGVRASRRLQLDQLLEFIDGLV